MDIVLAIIIFLLVAGSSVLGVYVSLHPPQTRASERTYLAIFALLTILGAFAIGWQTVLARRSSDALNTQVGDIKQQTVPPPHHTHVAFLSPATKVIDTPSWPFHPGDKPQAPVGYKNVGDYYLDESRDTHDFIPVPMQDVESAYAAFLKGSLPGTRSSRGTAMAAHSGDQVYSTTPTSPLTSSDIKELKHGDKVLLVMARAQWKDETGWYQTDLCQYMSRENGKPGYNWHICGDNGIEKKIEGPSQPPMNADPKP